jgi:hypothetical protein
MVAGLGGVPCSDGQHPRRRRRTPVSQYSDLTRLAFAWCELNLRPTTWTTYQGLLDAYLIPTLGAVELQRLTPGHFSVLYRELLTSGRRHRPGRLAPKTVRNVHVLIHRVLKDAVRWGYVVRNVADAADPPKVKPAKLQVWSPDQLRAFLAHVQGDRQYAAWLLAATTGMRRGELLGAALGRRRPGRRPHCCPPAARGCRPRRSRLGAEDGQEPAVDRARPGDGGRPAPAPGAPGGRPGSSWPGLRGLRAGLHPSGRLADPPSGSPTGSGSTFAQQGCRNPSARPAPQLRAGGARRRHPRPRSSVNGSGTRPSPSRWTPTATSCLAWTGEPPRPWPG